MAATTQETSKPLDSAEISRMFDAMRAATFEATPDAHNQAKTAFTAKSLFDIARSATREDKVVGTAKAQGMPSIAEIEEAEVVGDAVSVAQDLADTFAPEAVRAEAAAEAFDDFAPQTPQQPPSLAQDPGPRPANLDELKAEWGRGFSAGEERARADLSAQVEARMAILDAAIEAFRSADAVAKLRQEIIEAVKDLASIRAGSQIDDMPEAYIAKIEDLVDRIRTDLAQPRLRLNPEDIAAVRPYLQASETLASVTITSDPDLARGDLELSTDGLRYADRLMAKPPSAPKAGRKTASSGVEATGSGTGAAV